MFMRVRQRTVRVDVDWIFERTAWIISTLGPDVFFSHTNLVLPTRRYFPEVSLTSEAAVGCLFDAVRTHLGMAHWPCRLVPRVVASGAEGAPDPDAIAGTFLMDDYGGVITYDPRLRHRNALAGRWPMSCAISSCMPMCTRPPGGRVSMSV